VPTCDPWAGLIPVESGTGCVLRVQLGIADDWQLVGLVLASFALVALGALVVTTLARR